ncbi:hypothetical protein RUM43_006219 [Polyplax serrata]|uniref:Uncharacterized protein n=1 Tax=Polyplax serrata TaxID=468196 RepID=A0AAN8PKV5_POLSC
MAEDGELGAKQKKRAPADFSNTKESCSRCVGVDYRGSSPNDETWGAFASLRRHFPSPAGCGRGILENGD